MPLSRHEDETVAEQIDGLMAGGQGAAEAQHQVGVAAGQIGRDHVLLESADVQPDAGRLALQAGQQAGQHGEGHEVVGHDHEVAGGGGRIEGRRGRQGLLDGQQGGAHRAHQREGAFRRDHAAAPPDQQRITEQRAQLPQRIADGRLRQAEARAGAAHAPLGEERVQDRQEVQVDGADIHRNE